MRYPEHRPRQIDGKRVASSEYRSWQMMKNRCLNKRGQDYEHYRTRGITVCARWLDFDNFLDDMGLKPFASASLERVDNRRGYNPGNCCWASKRAQSRNRSSARVVRGFRVWELAEQCRVKSATIHHRLWRVGRGAPMRILFAAGRKNKRRFL